MLLHAGEAVPEAVDLLLCSRVVLNIDALGNLVVRVHGEVALVPVRARRGVGKFIDFEVLHRVLPGALGYDRERIGTHGSRWLRTPPTPQRSEIGRVTAQDPLPLWTGPCTQRACSKSRQSVGGRRTRSLIH